MDKEKIKKAVTDLLEAIGEDVNRPGIKRTPERIADLYEELLSGTMEEAGRIIQETHELEHDGMILLKDIPFYSMCEHHLLPFFGKCHIAYIPDENKILGLSKITQVVDILSKQLQVQERLTTQIVNTIMKNLKPKGVGLVMEARHLCLEMRGANRSDPYTVTSYVEGLFRKDLKTREEFMKLIK
ncbi:MAG: GTP cyclohydrolase I FolE [Spirochaetes bacterium]|nr:GTP cyclohydrolase I FolE [Spirochaetota bacterium]